MSDWVLTTTFIGLASYSCPCALISFQSEYLRGGRRRGVEKEEGRNRWSNRRSSYNDKYNLCHTRTESRRACNESDSSEPPNTQIVSLAPITFNSARRTRILWSRHLQITPPLWTAVCPQRLLRLKLSTLTAQAFFLRIAMNRKKEENRLSINFELLKPKQSVTCVAS